MDKKSKILLVVFCLLIIGAVGVTYWRIFIARDYVIENQIDCDPTVDACFIWECDPNSKVEGEACTGDPESDIWYYEIARRKAANIPSCDPTQDETCDPWTCEENEKDCSVTFCDDTNKVEQGVECNDPVQYNIDNPAEEEESECAEDDEECLAAEEEALAAEEATECAEGDEECLAAEETLAAEEVTECAEGDEECLAAEEAAAADEGNVGDAEGDITDKQADTQ